jgi:mannuronan synthase
MSGLDQHRVESPLGSDLLGLAILIAAFAALAAAAAALERMLLSFGAIGIWRYTWAGIHVARALIYQLAAFPRLRTRVAGAPKATHVYVVVLSYRMAREVNAAVYSALVRDLEDYQRPATVIACVSDPADADTLRHVKLGKGIELIALQQSDHGKREAMERALNLLGARPVPSHSCLVLMDGDTIVPTGTLRRVAPVLTGQPDVGAVTTNNIAAVDGAPRIREWYRLRMQQRHLLMSSNPYRARYWC